MKKACLTIIAAAMLSVGSFAGILAEGVGKSAARDSVSTASEKITEARNYVMENTNFHNGFGDLWGAANELSKVVKPDSEQAEKLRNLKESIDTKGFKDSSDTEVIEEARAFYEEGERLIKEILEDIRAEADALSEPTSAEGIVSDDFSSKTAEDSTPK